jgi:hypothetical protein
MSGERFLRLLDAAGWRDDILTAGWLEYRNVAQEIREIREIRVISAPSCTRASWVGATDLSGRRRSE